MRTHPVRHPVWNSQVSLPPAGSAEQAPAVRRLRVADAGVAPTVFGCEPAAVHAALRTGSRQHLLSQHIRSQRHTSPVSRPNKRCGTLLQRCSPTAKLAQGHLQQQKRRCSPFPTFTGPTASCPPCLPSSKLLLQVSCATSAPMLRSALSRLAPAAAASQRCTPFCLSAFGGQPLSGSLQQTRSVISVKVYPGKLQAAQRALTRVLMGDKVRTLALCTVCCLLVRHGKHGCLAFSMWGAWPDFPQNA